MTSLTWALIIFSLSQNKKDKCEKSVNMWINLPCLQYLRLEIATDQDVFK